MVDVREEGLLRWWGMGIAEWLASRITKQEGPVSNPVGGGAKKFSMELVNIYHVLSCSFV